MSNTSKKFIDLKDILSQYYDTKKSAIHVANLDSRYIAFDATVIDDLRIEPKSNFKIFVRVEPKKHFSPYRLNFEFKWKNSDTTKVVTETILVDVKKDESYERL